MFYLEYHIANLSEYWQAEFVGRILYGSVEPFPYQGMSA